MNKNFKYYAGIWAILLVIFNLATFVSPNEAAGMTKFGGAFWVGYIFIALALGEEAPLPQSAFFRIPFVFTERKNRDIILLSYKKGWNCI